MRRWFRGQRYTRNRHRGCSSMRWSSRSMAGSTYGSRSFLTYRFRSRSRSIRGSRHRSTASGRRASGPSRRLRHHSNSGNRSGRQVPFDASVGDCVQGRPFRFSVARFGRVELARNDWECRRGPRPECHRHCIGNSRRRIRRPCSRTLGSGPALLHFVTSSAVHEESRRRTGLGERDHRREGDGGQQRRKRVVIEAADDEQKNEERRRRMSRRLVQGTILPAILARIEVPGSRGGLIGVSASGSAVAQRRGIGLRACRPLRGTP